MLLKELQSLGLDVRLLRDDNTEVEITESVDYGNPEVSALLNSDRAMNDYEESYGSMGYQTQEFSDEGELVDTAEEQEPDDYPDMDDLDDYIGENDNDF